MDPWWHQNLDVVYATVHTTVLYKFQKEPLTYHLLTSSDVNLWWFILTHPPGQFLVPEGGGGLQVQIISFHFWLSFFIFNVILIVNIRWSNWPSKNNWPSKISTVVEFELRHCPMPSAIVFCFLLDIDFVLVHFPWEDQEEYVTVFCFSLLEKRVMWYKPTHTPTHTRVGGRINTHILVKGDPF